MKSLLEAYQQMKEAAAVCPKCKKNPCECDSVEEELGEAKSYGGGSDNAGGHNVYYTASDGTSQSVYRPGKNQGDSSEPSTHSNAPDPKHPLHGKTVTNGKITGRLVGTSAQGKSAHIKVGDAIHVVDAKSVKKHSIKEEVEELEEDGMLDVYLRSRGLNPATITTDKKIAYAKGSDFLRWKQNHS